MAKHVPTANGTEMTGATSLVKSLEAAGVEVMFGLPGGAILPAYDPIFDSTIRHILVRHEQGAGHAATGYAQVTGRAGVCIATSGPGATNLVTPLDGCSDGFSSTCCNHWSGSICCNRYRCIPRGRYSRHHNAIY